MKKLPYWNHNSALDDGNHILCGIDSDESCIERASMNYPEYFIRQKGLTQCTI